MTRVTHTPIEMRVCIDDDPDTSYLDQERLQQYNNHEFGYVGVVATCLLVISDDDGTNSRYYRMSSNGLWGIESDSGDAYLEEVFAEERHALADDMAALITTNS